MRAWEGGDCMIVHWEHGRVVTARLIVWFPDPSFPRLSRPAHTGRVWEPNYMIDAWEREEEEEEAGKEDNLATQTPLQPGLVPTD